jgi:hypothetical protein
MSCAQIVSFGKLQTLLLPRFVPVKQEVAGSSLALSRPSPNRPIGSADHPRLDPPHARTTKRLRRTAQRLRRPFWLASHTAIQQAQPWQWGPTIRLSETSLTATACDLPPVHIASQPTAAATWWQHATTPKYPRRTTTPPPSRRLRWHQVQASPPEEYDKTAAPPPNSGTGVTARAATAHSPIGATHPCASWTVLKERLLPACRMHTPLEKHIFDKGMVTLRARVLTGART